MSFCQYWDFVSIWDFVSNWDLLSIWAFVGNWDFVSFWNFVIIAIVSVIGFLQLQKTCHCILRFFHWVKFCTVKWNEIGTK